MKIIYLHQYFVTPSMSGGTRSYEMAKRLVEKGHEVHIISSNAASGRGDGVNHEVIDGINVHWISVKYNNTMGFQKRLLAFFKFALMSYRKAVEIKGDVVFATSTPLTIALPGVFASRKLKTKMIFEVRDLWPEMPIAIGALRNPVLKWLAYKLEKFAYQNSSHIIALSPAMAEGVQSTGYPKDKITVIPNGSDIELFKPCPSKAMAFRNNHAELGNGKIVLYAGALGKINGVGYLVQAASEMQRLKPDVRFVVVGAGIEKEKIVNEAKNLGVLNKNFFLYPPMSKVDLVGAFLASDIITSMVINLPAAWGNSANKFFDGLASGKPMVINYQGWQADLIREYKAGLAIDTDAQLGVVELSHLLDDDAKLKVYGNNALRLANEKFHRDKLASQFISVIETAS